MKQIQVKNSPVAIDKFCSEMKTKFESFGIFASEGIMKLQEQLCASYNKVINDNQSGEEPVMYVMPPATGTGKTTSIKLYCAMMPKHISALIIVPKVEHAKDVCKSINDYANEEIAYCSYTVTADNPDHSLRVEIESIQKHRIIVITHERFRRDIKSKKSILGYASPNEEKDWLGRVETKNRDLIIVDEQINMIESETLESYELEKMSLLARQLPNEETKKIVNTIVAMLKSLIDESREITAITKEKNMDWNLFISPLIEVLSSKDTSWYKLSRAEFSFRRNYKKESNEIELREGFIDALKSLCLILDRKMFFHKHGTNWTLHGVNLLYHEFGSLVVLDATSEVNKKIELMKEWISIKNQNPKHFKADRRLIENIKVPNPRTYHNCKLYLCKENWVRHSRTGLNIDNEAECKLTLEPYIKSIKQYIEPHDDALIITYKDIAITMKSLIGLENANVIHWGSHDATNEYRHCNKVFIVGLNHLPYSVMFEQFSFIVGGVEIAYEVEENRKIEIPKLATSKLAEDIIQGVFRSRARVSKNHDGSPDSTEFFIFLGKETNKNKEIIDLALEAMPNIQVLDWELKHSVPMPPKKNKVSEQIEMLIDVLEAYAHDGYSDVLRETIENRMAVTKVVMKRLLSNQVCINELGKAGFRYIAGNGRQKSVFTMP